MSNVNNYEYANNLEVFKKKVLDPQIERVAKATEVMNNPNHKWKDESEKEAAQAKYDSYKAWMQFYQAHYDMGVRLCTQHENLVNKMSKVYDAWYENISNDGRQEAEMMSSQADILHGLFVDIYAELKPLGLDMPMPKAMNL